MTGDGEAQAWSGRKSVEGKYFFTRNFFLFLHREEYPGKRQNVFFLGPKMNNF